MSSWDHSVPLMPLGTPSNNDGGVLRLPNQPQYSPTSYSTGYPPPAGGGAAPSYPVSSSSGYPAQPGHSVAASQPPAVPFFQQQPSAASSSARPFNPMDQYVDAERRGNNNSTMHLRQQQPSQQLAGRASAYLASSGSSAPQQQQRHHHHHHATSSSKAKTSNEILHFVDGERLKKDSYSSMEYLKSTHNLLEEDVVRARNEHVDQEPDLCMTDTELRDYAGTAIFVYFRFLKFVMVIIAIHFILSLVNFVMYTDAEKPQFSSTEHRMWYSDFFISHYSEKQRDAWLGTTVVGLVVVVLGLVFYRQVWIGWFKFEDTDQSMAEIEEAHLHRGGADAIDTIVRFNKDGLLDVAAHYRSAGELTMRRLTSFLIFGGFIAVQVLSSIAITTSSESNDNSVGGSFAIAFIAAALNIAFTMISRKLTEFEKYERLASADRSLVLKLVMFKVANIMAVYGAKRYGAKQCVYDVIGEQFMTMLLVEIFFTTPSTIASAAVLTKNNQWIAELTGSINGDHRNAARFELPVEYLAVLYKFLMAGMAMVVFPLSTILAFFAFLVEFWGARYRLVKLCGKPVKSEANHRTVVVMIMLMIFVCVLVTPFAGAVFILSGESMHQTNTTALCGNFPN